MRLRHHLSRRRGRTGDVVLIPPQGGIRTVCERFDLALVQLRAAPGAYAAATTDLDPDRLAFDAITLLSPTRGRYWIDTVAHVRDDVLADPWASRSPIVLDQTFRTLAAALLSTFPITALAHATDPGAPPVGGEVGEVVEGLRRRGDRRPVGTRRPARRPRSRGDRRRGRLHRRC